MKINNTAVDMRVEVKLDIKYFVSLSIASRVLFELKVYKKHQNRNFKLKTETSCAEIGF